MSTLPVHAILRIAADAYAEESDGLCTLPPTRADALAHTNGDTLGDFIVIELCEVLEGEAPPRLLSRAIDALSTARDQLNAVISALEDHVEPEA